MMLIQAIGLFLTLFILFFGVYAVKPAFRRWQGRRADQRAINETLAFMEKWKTYDNTKKARDIPMPATKQDPYAFDQSMRELVGAIPTAVTLDDDEIIADAAKHMKHMNNGG